MKIEIKCQIVTGQYQSADSNAQLMIRNLFGRNAEYRYEIYFHWYNLIHELGHAIMMFNNPARPHPAEEEQLVNDFAVAYWRHYGETDKLRDLEDAVTDTLSKFPALTDGDYLEYTKNHWGEDILRTFEGYGWFQFSSVQKALRRDLKLDQALCMLSPFPLIPQEKRILRYAVDGSMAQNVVAEAIHILRSWGISLPQQIPVSLCGDVNCHMFCCEDYDLIRNQVMQSKGETNDK